MYMYTEKQNDFNVQESVQKFDFEVDRKGVFLTQWIFKTKCLSNLK